MSGRSAGALQLGEAVELARVAARVGSIAGRTRRLRRAQEAGQRLSGAARASKSTTSDSSENPCSCRARTASRRWRWSAP